MNTEQSIVSNLLFYEESRHILPKINKNWFKDSLLNKLIDVMTTLYYENKPIDMVSLMKYFSQKDILFIVQLQQNATGMSSVSYHLQQLEYAYIKENLVQRITSLNLTKELKEMVVDLQKIIDETTFSSHKEPSSIVKVTNKVVDEIVENIEKGNALTGKQTGWR